MFKKLLFIALLLPTIVFAHSYREKGIELTRTLWRDLKTNNVSHAKKYVSYKYQALEPGGHSNRSQLLAEIKGADLASYSLSDFIVTKSENLLVVTYTATILETFQGHTISGTAPRMTIWQNDNDHWKLIGHDSLAQPPA